VSTPNPTRGQPSRKRRVHEVFAGDGRSVCDTRGGAEARRRGGNWRAHALKRFTTNVSFCPPKPKEFERQMSTFALRALFGT
jgi:hypothetical protein